MWGDPLLIRGVVLSGGEFEDVVYKVAECQMCGAIVDEGMQSVHERYHACQDVPPAE